jgi:Bacterial pre-peptidase C-terminal domain/Bacterial Ig-like domain
MRAPRAALVGIGLVLAAQLAVVPAAAASPTDNIPGVALPSDVVTGQLGGPIYDVVYRVTVPAAHVLTLSLTGTSGTDFDLYLFDAGASDIYANPPVGLVAQSTGPTSTETINYASIGGGTYYVDLSGATNVMGAYRLATRIAADTTPPVVSLLIDGGAPATNSPNVIATVLASDDLSGVSDMQLSQDGLSWSDWQPYTPTVAWLFPTGDGQKDLWVRVRDRAGNISAPASASITLLTTLPRVIARDPDPSSPTTGTRPTIRVTFSENMRVSSWFNYGLILQDSVGTSIYGKYGWDAATWTGTFTPDYPLVPGAAYFVSLGPVVDEAGNGLVPIGSWVIRPMIEPTLSLASSPRVAPSGATAELSGSLVDGQGAPVLIERSVGGGSWAPFVTVFPADDGSFTTGARVDANTSFRASVAATDISAAATSPSTRVLVRREVTLKGVSASTTRTTYRYRTTVVRAVAGPTAPEVPIMLRVYRYDAARRKYIVAATQTRTSVGGTASFSWRPTVAGRYYLRVTTPPTSLYANGISSAYRWIVR